MRSLLFRIALLGCLVLAPLWAEAYEVLILQSSPSPVYDQVLRGVRSARRFSERLLVLSEYSEVDLQRIVREERPLVILALGDEALNLARSVRRLPVVGLLSSSLRAVAASHPSLTGVEVQVAPERYLAIFQVLKSRRVGVIGNPVVSGHYIGRARQAAVRHGIELVVREVESAREVSGQLAALRGSVDALWLLPDTTAVARENVEAYFLFSMQQQVPVVAFSAAYLPAGAAVAVEIDRHDVGRQGGELVAALLRGEEMEDLPPTTPRRAVLRYNQTVLRRLGIPSDNVVRSAEQP